MGLRDSLEAKAKKWALDKANDLLGDKDKTADQPAAAAPPPPPTADSRAEADVQAQVGEKMVRSMFPKLGAWADQQKAELDKQQAAEAAKRRAAIAALPKADVKIQLSGSFQAHWWGQLPVKVETQPPVPAPDEFAAKDPFVTGQTLLVELSPQDDARPPLADRALYAWRITVPGYTGDATYDLVGQATRREAAEYEAPYDENYLDVGGEAEPDLQFYFYSDAGPATVTVADGGHQISASVSMSGAVGTILGTVEITLPQAAPTAGSG